MLKDYRIRSFLSFWLGHGDLFKHLGLDSSADHFVNFPERIFERS